MVVKINMYTTKLRIAFSLTTVQKELIRRASVSNASVKVEEQAVLKPWKEIPGPSSLPLLGPLIHFLPGGILYNLKGNELSALLHKRYGPIVKLESTFGTDTLIFLYDAESCEKVLRGENQMPIRTEFKSLEYYRKVYQKKNTGESVKVTGLITDQGSVWKDFRSTVNQALLPPKTVKLYTAVLDQIAQEMIARMKFSRDENNMLRGQFDVEMNLWSLEAIGVIALGSRLNCFDPNLPEDSPARKLIQCIHDLFVIAFQLDLRPNLWQYISTPTFKKAMKLYEDQENLTKYFVKKAIKEFKTNKNFDEEKGVLEKLLEINEEYAYIMASDMLFAGLDTAATAMTATLYLLATNPEKQQKLREEVMSKQGNRPYMRACIKESMRMMPVLSSNVRRTTKEYSILGYHIPKNMDMHFAHQDMSMMEKYYPRPQEYIPERWLVEKSDPLYHGNSHPFAYSPFGFGIRTCIGRRIAELEVETFLGRLIENFHVEWFGPPPKVEETTVNYVKGPFNFIFKDV